MADVRVDGDPPVPAARVDDVEFIDLSGSVGPTEAAAPRVPLPTNYKRAILQDVLTSDGLLVISKGLGLRDIICKMLKVYCVPDSLVFVLNCNTDAALYRRYLAAEGTRPLVNVPRLQCIPLARHAHCLCVVGIPSDRLPSIVNNETPAANRKALYASGGVVFVTSRILVMDLLTQRLNPNLVTGFVLCNAHTLTEHGTEAFILRIYRRKSCGGFVKAFTDDPGALSASFGKLERTLRTLTVRKLFLWPRFHMAVRQQLKKTEPEVLLFIPLLSRACISQY